MFTLNIFDIYLIMLHKIAFSCSPINRNRFKKEFFKLNYADDDLKVSFNQERKIIETPQNGNYILWSLRHPLLAISLVKRYHMFSILFSVGDDKASLVYLKSIYYPHIAHFSRRPSNFGSTTLAFGLLMLCIRLRNIAYMTAFNFTPSQWLEFWRHASNHRRAIENDELNYKCHLKFNRKIYEQSLNCYKKNLACYYNLIDFEECYSGVKFIKSSERQSKYGRAWHTAYPVDRLSHVDIQYLLLAFPILIGLVFAGILICCLAMLYRDLASHYPDEYFPSLFELVKVIPGHFADFSLVIRQIELNFFLFCQLPQIFECFKVATDVFITDSRANKVIDIFREHLKYCQMRERESLRILITERLDTELGAFNQNFKSLNEHIKRDIGLARTIYLEFINIRDYHCSFLNVLVLCSGVFLPIVVPVAMIESDFPELIVLILSFIACTGPMLLNLLICARIEHTLRTMYRIIDKLRCTRGGIIEPKTRKLLSNAIEPLVKKEARSFVIGGLYAVSLNSLGPFIAYMASAVLIMQKANSL